MPFAVALAAGALAVAAVGTYASIKAGQKQAKFARQANAAQRSQDNLRAARERKEAVRAARLARGASTQAAVNQGASGTSASLGALGSIDSQLNSGLSFLDQYNSLSDQASVAMGKANQAGSKAQMWGQVADLGMTVFQNSSSIAGVFKGG